MSWFCKRYVSIMNLSPYNHSFKYDIIGIVAFLQVQRIVHSSKWSKMAQEHRKNAVDSNGVLHIFPALDPILKSRSDICRCAPARKMPIIGTSNARGENCIALGGGGKTVCGQCQSMNTLS